jgi:hypothetical protein
MKQPNWKMPLILSLTLAICGTAVYWFEYSRKPKVEREKTTAKKPIPIADEDTQIVSFKVRGSKGVFEGRCLDRATKKCSSKNLGLWTIQGIPADSENIKNFLTSVSGLLSTETIDLTEETAEKRTRMFEDYGLSATKRDEASTPMIEVTLDGGKKLTAWFGIEHPVGDKTFVASAVDGKNQRSNGISDFKLLKIRSRS